MPPTSTRREMPQYRLLLVFLLAVIVTYVLVFATGGGTTPKLGIDLQGGTRVTLTPRTENGQQVKSQDLKTARDILERRVNGLGVAGSEVVITGSNLVITVPGKDGAQARSLGQTARLWVRPVIISQAAVANKPPVTAGKTPAVQIQEAKALRQRPGTMPEATAQAQLTPELAKLDCATNALDPLAGSDNPNDYLATCGDGDTAGSRVAYLLGPQIIDGRDVANASATTRQGTGEWVVTVDYKGKGAETWRKYTAANINKVTAVVLDSQVVSAAEIQGAISGTTEISGNFTQKDAKNLANVMKYGSLPLSFEASDAQTVSATLGKSSLWAGLIAGIVGLAAVLLYSLAYYRALGVLIMASLFASGVLVYSIMVLLGRWIGFTLDLSGIAGLIIGIGMTADSFVVYFERIKDEMREGRTFRSAVPRGWARARRTIWSGNAVSFLAAAVLYYLAIGDVRGFAFTLGLTTILDLVVVFLVTHPLLHYASRNSWLSNPRVNGLGGVTEIARERRQSHTAQTEKVSAE